MLDSDTIKKMKGAFSHSLRWQKDWQYDNISRIDGHEHDGHSYIMDSYAITDAKDRPVGMLIVWIRGSYDDIRKMQMIHISGPTRKWTHRNGLYGFPKQEEAEHVQG